MRIFKHYLVKTTISSLVVCVCNHFISFIFAGKIDNRQLEAEGRKGMPQKG